MQDQQLCHVHAQEGKGGSLADAGNAVQFAEVRRVLSVHLNFAGSPGSFGGGAGVLASRGAAGRLFDADTSAMGSVCRKTGNAAFHRLYHAVLLLTRT
ncbi:hypothetical protein [Stenotrophomonas sp. Marseille-Q4652]|uniref:hypothetical protein n=1 Tax=Stenotrophomonas sp. Marseille-Q4652 TaxID=2866595 RepID=UPI001CE41DC9|nr:hypothetical protein [Stenotrophomonas sp. Marseille-Q4652]